MHSQNNSWTITYLVRSTVDENAPKIINDILSFDQEPIYIDLSYNDSISICKYDNAYFLADNFDFSTAQIMADLNSYVCNNYELKTIYYNSEIDSSLYLVNKKYNLSNYEFLEEHKTIKGVKCKKAIRRSPSFTNNRIINTIWYSEDIKLPIGPFKFVGFPGMVMEVTTNLYSIEISNTSESIKELTCELKGIDISETELSTLKRQNRFNKWKNRN